MEKRNLRIGLALMASVSVCTCFGQLLWKLSNGTNFLFIFFGFALYGAGLLIMVVAYRFGELSVLHPMLSLSYVLSTVIAVTVLHENVTPVKLMSIIIILLGVILIGGSK